jgi:ribosomal protein S21
MQTIMTTTHKVAALIPHGQYSATIEHIEAFEEALIRLEKQLERCPKLRETDGMKEHPAIFHYFCGATDIYICEFDGIDEMFGFTILNGDLYNAEWGYSSLSEIASIPVMNIDYYFEEQSIEAALYRQYPKHFKMPASLEKQCFLSPAVRRGYFPKPSAKRTAKE